MINKPYFKVKLLNNRAILPFKREEDGAFDIYTTIEEDFIFLKPGDIKLLPTGIAIEIPTDWIFYIAERGSTGSKGLARRCGVIDSGFRGEIFVPTNNTSNKNIVIARHTDEKLDEFLTKNNLNKEETTIYPLSKAVAQGMLIYSPHIEIEQVDELGQNTERGNGVLGSSGK